MTEPAKPRVLAQVAPRYLAGGGDPRWVTVPLQNAFRWQAAHQPLSPGVRLTSRDQQAELLLSPDPDQPWWTLRHHGAGEEEAWTVTFGARTPAEIVATATDAFATAGGSRAVVPQDVLGQAGWKGSPNTGFVSPDGHLAVTRNAWGSWHITAATVHSPWNAAARRILVWEGLLTSRTPSRVVAAVFTGLVSPDPVLRDEKAMVPFLRYSARIARKRIPARQAEEALWERVDRLSAQRPNRALPPTPGLPGVPLPRRTR
ncbi:DUF317 domain-containing protein [Streptomyces sp. NPDC048717]|uniref:DUF317 domain-containing protein n=1 Tax=Streptomyces sp. NPDC048717 TaxID=3154928 RepID=UPI00343A4E5E